MTRRSDRRREAPPEHVEDALDEFAAWAAMHLERPTRVAARAEQARPDGHVAPGAPDIGEPGDRGRRIVTPRIRLRDLEAMHQLARTGVAAQRHLLEGAGLTVHRLDCLTEAGYLSRNERIVDSRLVRVYTLGAAGIRRLRRDDFGPRYKRNPHQLAHDLKLTEMYYALPPPVRATWRHEGELTAAMKAAGTYAGACVDAAVELDGQWVAIEALSAHYSQAQIAAKEAVIAAHFDGRAVML